MNYSATPSPSQCPTEAVDMQYQNIHTPQDNAADVTPTKAIKDCTWSDILVSPEETNPCVRDVIEHLDMLSPIHSHV